MNIKKIIKALAVSVGVFTSWADEWTDSSGYTWAYQINDDTVEIYKEGGSRAISPEPTGALTIPSTLGDKPVTSIGARAFRGCSELTSVTIPDSVKSIGARAFRDCRELTSVTIPDSVTSIGKDAFEYCWCLTSVTIGNGVTSIGDGAFASCSGLTSVTIPDSVKSIGRDAFAGCSGLTSVTIPDSVTSIGRGAFYKCSGLTSVTIPDSVKSIGKSAFEGCSGLTSVTIPDVTDVNCSAFDRQVTIGRRMTVAQKRAVLTFTLWFVPSVVVGLFLLYISAKLRQLAEMKARGLSTLAELKAVKVAEEKKRTEEEQLRIEKEKDERRQRETLEEAERVKKRQQRDELMDKWRQEAAKMGIDISTCLEGSASGAKDGNGSNGYGMWVVLIIVAIAFGLGMLTRQLMLEAKVHRLENGIRSTWGDDAADGFRNGVNLGRRHSDW